MPKILRIINRLNLGGPTYNAAYLSKYLSPEYETMLVAGIKDDSEESSEFIVREMGLTPVYIPEMRREINLLKDRLAYQQIKKIIKDFKPDIVHSHASKAGTLGRLAAVACNVPVIVHTFHGHVFHSYFSPLKTMVYVGIERYLASKSTAIIAVSEKQKYELGEVYKICKPEKINVIHLGFDLARFRENQEEKRAAFRKKFLIDDDEIAVGIIGRIVPVKNHEMFLRSLKLTLDHTDHKVRAFIIGDGEDRNKTESLARELGIPYISERDHITKAPLTFTSWIKEIDRAYAGLDIIALTSLNEGTPVSLIEAQAAGKPVVSTNVGGIENIVIPGKTAFLSEKNDIEVFAGNLIRLVNEDGLRKEMIASCSMMMNGKFNYTSLVSNMNSLYKQLLNNQYIRG